MAQQNQGTIPRDELSKVSFCKTHIHPGIGTYKEGLSNVTFNTVQYFNGSVSDYGTHINTASWTAFYTSDLPPLLQYKKPIMRATFAVLLALSLPFLAAAQCSDSTTSALCCFSTQESSPDNLAQLGSMQNTTLPTDIPGDIGLLCNTLSETCDPSLPLQLCCSAPDPSGVFALGCSALPTPDDSTDPTDPTDADDPTDDSDPTDASDPTATGDDSGTTDSDSTTDSS